MWHAADRIGPYSLIRRIGSGAFSDVWLAQKATSLLTSQYALKLLRPEVDSESIIREATVWLAAGEHTNVLPITDAEIYDGQVVIVTEYLPDGSLLERLRQRGEIVTLDAVQLMMGILSGLHHLHDRRIVHRDLKPENILLQGDTPRLTDFGIARLLKDSVEFSDATVAGTIAYMAPEALDGYRSARTDLWSAGVIFYRLLSGHLPFKASSLEVISAIKHAEPIPLPASVSEPIKQCLIRALEKKPEARYQSAAEMRAALIEALATEQTEDVPCHDAEEMCMTLTSDSTILSPTLVSDCEQETTTVVAQNKAVAACCDEADFRQHHVGDHLDGAVSRITEEGVVIDLGENHFGIVDPTEFMQDGQVIVSPGDELNVVLGSLSKTNSYFVLFNFDAVVRSYKLLRKQFRGKSNGARIRGRILQSVRNGFRVNVYGVYEKHAQLTPLAVGIDAFLPLEEVEGRLLCDRENISGQDIDAIVTKFDEAGGWISDRHPFSTVLRKNVYRW